MKKMLYIILGFVFLIHSCNTDNHKTIDNDSRFVISTPGQEGFDKQLFNEILIKIEKGNYGALTSLIVISNNKLIAEHYFHGWRKDSVHSVQSVSKSITSLLIGKAIELGEISSVNEKINCILPELKIEKLEIEKDSLSIKHFLTMSAGFDWSEKYLSMDKRSSLYNLYHQDRDYIKYVFNQQ